MSNLIPREFIHDLLSRCDLVELIDVRVPLKKKGANYSACCPFHQEKTPSFTVSASKQIYHCFGCHASGNAIGFLMEFDRLTFVEAVEELAKHLGIEVPRQARVATGAQLDLYPILEQAAYYFQQQLKTAPVAIDYLKKRGLSGRIAKEFGIGYAPASWDGLIKEFKANAEICEQLLAAGLVIKKNEGGYYDRFRDRVMFPIRDRRGRVIAFGGRIINDGEPKYLNSPETAVFHKGNELYGIFEVTQASRNVTRLIVVEGYMDVVALAQHGIKQAVATLGTATSAEHIQRLFRLTEEVVFCFDGDAAGQAAAWRALEATLPLLQDGWQVRFLLLPPGEDPDSLIRKEGVEAFNQRVKNANSLADFLLGSLTSQVEMGSVAGKAHLVKLAAPLLHKIPENIFKHMLFDRLASLVRMDVNALKKLTPSNSSSKKNPETKTDELQAIPMRRSAMRLAIALLVQNPNLAQSLPDLSPITALNLPGSRLLQELLELLQQVTDLNTGTLLEYWRERPERVFIEQLASWETGVPAAGVEGEFLGVIDKLLNMGQEQQIELLLQKATLAPLTSEEKITLQQLIASNKNG